MVYGVASQELPTTEFDKYARTCSASAGLGGCISLLLGPFLFSIGGYFLPYWVLSSSFIILSLIIYLSGTLDKKEKEIVKEILLVDNSGEIWFQSENLKEKQIDLKFVLSIPVSLNQS